MDAAEQRRTTKGVRAKDVLLGIAIGLLVTMITIGFLLRDDDTPLKLKTGQAKDISEALLPLVQRAAEQGAVTRKVTDLESLGDVAIGKEVTRIFDGAAYDRVDVSWEKNHEVWIFKYRYEIEGILTSRTGNVRVTLDAAGKLEKIELEPLSE
jgi:hypothetical protein